MQQTTHGEVVEADGGTASPDESATMSRAGAINTSPIPVSNDALLRLTGLVHDGSTETVAGIRPIREWAVLGASGCGRQFVPR